MWTSIQSRRWRVNLFIHFALSGFLLMFFLRSFSIYVSASHFRLTMKKSIFYPWFEYFPINSSLDCLETFGLRFQSLTVPCYTCSCIKIYIILMLNLHIFKGSMNLNTRLKKCIFNPLVNSHTNPLWSVCNAFCFVVLTVCFS